MTDRATEKLLDAAAAAIRMEKLEGQHNLLALQVKTSIDAMTATLNAVQQETRAVSNKLADVMALQHSHDANKEAIENVRESLSLLSAKIEQHFHDFDNRSTRKWEQHDRENVQTKIDFDKEVRAVRDTVNRFSAIGVSIALLSGIIVSGFLWSINYRFNEQAQAAERIEQATTYNRQLIDEMGREHGREINEIKLYLARGGRVPEEPYTDKPSRNDNAQARQPAK